MSKCKSKPKVFVNDKRYFVKDDMSVGALRAYAVYTEPKETGRVSA